jgi:hypothetical protein
MKKTYFLLFIIATFGINSCSVKYNFTGAGKINAETFQVNYFKNNAALIEPGIERTFTLELQETIQNQTNLNLVSSGGDLIYEGEIVDYSISPMTPTADQRSAQNRITIKVNLRFINKKNDKEDFEKQFSFYYDYEGDQQLTGSHHISKNNSRYFCRIIG